MNKNKIVYQLTVEDIQTVAEDLLDRELTAKEINQLIEPIAKRIAWYDAISDAIYEIFGTVDEDDTEITESIH